MKNDNDPRGNSWSIWRCGLMMRCSDTSISNISDEALPLVSVFLWGIPSHPIAGSPGRVLLGKWDAILEQGWSPSLIFGSAQLCESVPGHILDHLHDHQHQDRFEANLQLWGHHVGRFKQSQHTVYQATQDSFRYIACIVESCLSTTHSRDYPAVAFIPSLLFLLTPNDSS